jgi:hypothetical protein
MKTQRGFNSGLQVSCLALIFISQAVFSNSQDVQSCLAINDSDKRLVCYDSLFTRSHEVDSQNIVLKIDKLEKIEKAQESISEPESELERLKESLLITSEIISASKRGGYKIYIVLKNGQTWRTVQDIYDRIPVSKGQTVSISEGFFSGHVMKVEGKKVKLRVKKI